MQKNLFGMKIPDETIPSRKIKPAAAKADARFTDVEARTLSYLLIVTTTQDEHTGVLEGSQFKASWNELMHGELMDCILTTKADRSHGGRPRNAIEGRGECRGADCG